MIVEERFLKILSSQHISEKASTVITKSNTVVFKVRKNTTKLEIKLAIQKLFEVQVKKVTTLLVKGKFKRHGKHIGRRKDWKKAYITLKEGQNLDLISRVE